MSDKTEKRPAGYANLSDTAQWLIVKARENQTNSRLLQIQYLLNMSRNTSPWLSLSAGPSSSNLSSSMILHALVEFKGLVGNKKPWDYKQLVYGLRDCVDIYAGKQYYYDYDIWGNIHFGYIGLVAGFDRETLLIGAGFAQYVAGTKSTACNIGDIKVCDDPKDTIAIHIGFDLWERQKKHPTADILLNLIRAKRDQISSVSCSKNVQ